MAIYSGNTRKEYFIYGSGKKYNAGYRQSRKNYKQLYDLTSNNIDDIYCNSDNAIDMILNAFRFGYMQGAKATKAYINKSNKTVKGVCK